MKEFKDMIELRDLFVILVLIFLCYQQSQIYWLNYRVQELYYGELLQNEINTEMVKRLHLYEIKLKKD